MEIKTYAVVLAVGGKVAEIDTFSFDAEGLAEARGTFFRRCVEDLEMPREEIDDLGESFAYDDGRFSLILTETGNTEEGGVAAPPVVDGQAIENNMLHDHGNVI